MHIHGTLEEYNLQESLTFCKTNCSKRFGLLNANNHTTMVDNAIQRASTFNVYITIATAYRETKYGFNIRFIFTVHGHKSPTDIKSRESLKTV